MLKPTEVHLFNFSADFGSSTSIPCLRHPVFISISDTLCSHRTNRQVGRFSGLRFRVITVARELTVMASTASKVIIEVFMS